MCTRCCAPPKPSLDNLISPLVSFDDRHIPALDDLARDSIAPQFHAERLGTPDEGTFEDETFDEAHESSGTSGEEEESGVDDSGEVEGEDSEDHDSGDSDGDRFDEAPSTSYARPTAIVGSSLSTDNVQGMLLDQKILIEMRLPTVKLEIMQHVSDEFKKLKKFISTVVSASSSTTTTRTADVGPEPKQSDYGDFADYVGHHPSLDGPDKDMGINRQEGDDIAHTQPCPDDHPVPMPTRIEEVQAKGGHYSLPGDRDKEQNMLPTKTKHLQYTSNIEPCPDNDLVPMPVGTDEE
ncbi:Hypothetical predicted protein [Olea europaea subsp. europaea]|uniref:Uncharacterized protein n=1 Tax=Olea europaea subsp. europaea TaxID=158383 RepID=A0A8S0SR61_OLEEU|nr:Hypothetical predicted protein [Olea europaea subsp. europaea]